MLHVADSAKHVPESAEQAAIMPMKWVSPIFQWYSSGSPFVMHASGAGKTYNFITALRDIDKVSGSFVDLLDHFGRDYLTSLIREHLLDGPCESRRRTLSRFRWVDDEDRPETKRGFATGRVDLCEIQQAHVVRPDSDGGIKPWLSHVADQTPVERQLPVANASMWAPLPLKLMGV
ncbi:hypothetical protein [Actinokineospora fastidiosa]|uniref:Uncharacterized protein n=1 Tax=Actinokineospora fastidiosa TaxID=1816 RepID=A0A918GQM6_9PSEU|nr:hypothetical protein [Actinokineospora fastidiosa]GGS54410.1 hypothetical protein GCM10010171_56930 [Actinokineospora fastidiosa]